MDVSFFQLNGYQIFEKLLPLELIEDVRIALENDAARSINAACDEIGCKDATGIVAKIDAISHGRGGSVDILKKSTRDTLSGHISLETRLSATLRKIPNHSNLQSAIQALLGTKKIFMHMPPTARFVLPGNSHAGVPPHQDVSYNRHMSNFIVVWVPLVDIDDDCGGVLVYHGSGFEPEHPVTTNANEFWQSGIPVDGFTPVHCKIKRGDVLALNKLVIHASTPNRSDHIRYSVDHRFFGEFDTSTKHFLDLQTNEIVSPGGETK